MEIVCTVSLFSGQFLSLLVDSLKKKEKKKAVPLPKCVFGVGMGGAFRVRLTRAVISAPLPLVPLLSPSFAR